MITFPGNLSSRTQRLDTNIGTYRVRGMGWGNSTALFIEHVAMPGNIANEYARICQKIISDKTPVSLRSLVLYSDRVSVG